jgi:hypothetical protein
LSKCINGVVFLLWLYSVVAVCHACHFLGSTGNSLLKLHLIVHFYHTTMRHIIYLSLCIYFVTLVATQSTTANLCTHLVAKDGSVYDLTVLIEKGYVNLL